MNNYRESIDYLVSYILTHTLDECTQFKSNIVNALTDAPKSAEFAEESIQYFIDEIHGKCEVIQ